jgi:23S rRNA (cytosine1962-C5)-methyltransferase
MLDRASLYVASEPLWLRTVSWPGYALLDSGDGRKLERFGEVTVVRPEPQCLWRPGRSDWTHADAVFEARDDDDAGHWRINTSVPDTWPVIWNNLSVYARLTAFRHLGLFPEQSANWAWLQDQVRAAPAPPRILNLFGYTGVASLAVAAAGASVTHVDASKKAVSWARENATLSGLDVAPIRWICEDASKWVARELRRGATYDGIILDPPKYGRGPAGEIWRLYDNLPELLRGCAALLSDKASFLLLNAYAERISGVALSGLMAEAMQGRPGAIEWGELSLTEHGGGRGVGLSFFSRWTRA